jgi:20S proteasome alpha/beta subunit
MLSIKAHTIAMHATTALQARTRPATANNAPRARRFVYESEMPVGRLVRIVADKNQFCTQLASHRPYGLGLLVVGIDANGPCLYETSPSGEFWQCKAMALGARSQAAKTYLERKLDDFGGASMDDLVKHVLLALQARRRSCDARTAVAAGRAAALRSADARPDHRAPLVHLPTLGAHGQHSCRRCQRRL